MLNYQTPGVYVEEVNTGNEPIEGVSTSTVAFLGLAERGPATTTLITSFTQYANVFGQAIVNTGPVLTQPTVATGGAGYTNGSGNGIFPATVVGGTSSSPATVNVTLTGGIVTAVTSVSPGNYVIAPPSPAQITGLTGGTGATISFTVANAQSYLAYAVEGFFTNGGQQCYVQTVTSGSATDATLPAGTVNIAAINSGAFGNRIAVKIEPGSTSGSKLTAMYWSAMPPESAGIVTVDPTSRAPNDLRNPARVQPQYIEVFDNLDYNNLVSTNSFVNQINGVSNLIKVTQTTAGAPILAGLHLLTGGGDGWLEPIDFLGNPNALPGQKTGLDALTELSDVSLLCCPDAYALGNNDNINNALINQCEVLMDRFAILSAPLINENVGVPWTSFDSEYAAYYYPGVNIIDPLTGQTVLMPACGHIAGIYARTDNAVGVQQTPANQEILGIDTLQLTLTDTQQGTLNPAGINALRYFKGYGNLVWGGRTTSISQPDWKYICVRRIFIYVEQSILRATRWAVFGINDQPLWDQIRRSISDFLTRLWMDDVLQGATKDEAFFVRCDRTTMTQTDIDNGRLICIIGIAPVKPAEFVIFQIGQWEGGSSVTEQ
jgi:uncharacterized protein